MFEKILIANRGEIAVRIIKTCKKMGIKTVVIYSEADAEALHVKQADEAYLVGGPRVVESYLNAERIIGIAKNSKVDAIHPGYGFLSENAAFAKRCSDAGIVFIGPSPDVISLMGNKIEARQTMNQAGVPIIPGTVKPLTNIDEAAEVASNMGYPIMLKASAGGGGIGIQVVNDDQEFRKAFKANQNRAANYFGDGTMFIEKYIKNPRHIEVQILADGFGHIIHLWERECSIQRRHQKVVEEAPSPFLDEKTRKSITDTAVKAAKSIGYTNAGTIEFLVDSDKNFYFLEMNTRLQVEHPVTEEIVGMDMIEKQIQVAFGMPLNFNQADVRREGHAIEVRIYAEDPNTFYPSPGTITKFVIPKGKGIRNEVALGQGSVVTPFYDPMIAKLIVKGKNRDEAVTRLQEAFNNYEVEGVKTNIPMLRAISENPAFKAGNTTTDFILQHLQRPS